MREKAKGFMCALIISSVFLWVAGKIFVDLWPREKKEYGLSNFPLHQPGRYEFFVEQQGVMCRFRVEVVAEPINYGMLYFIEIEPLQDKSWLYAEIK